MKTIINTSNLHALFLPCKSECSFSLYVDRIENPSHYYFYLGLTLVDAVPNDRGHFLYKILCARLRLAGFQLAGLSTTFEYCEETISKWSKVLHKGNSHEIAKVFGLSCSGKITPEIKSYVKRRYIFFKLNSEYAYRKKIQAELADYFDIKVTGEGIRPLFREADAEFRESEEPCNHNDKSQSQNPENESINTYDLKQTDSTVSSTSNTTFEIVDKTGCSDVEIQSCPIVLKPVSSLCEAVEKPNSTCAPEIFFEAEPRKLTSDIQSLRTRVYNLATLKYRIVLGAVNMTNFIYSPIKRVFYYEPHTKKYTGCLKLLAGYCGSLHQTGKILVSDYIHDTDGKPCFVEHYDNMYDLRVRFFFTVEIFKKLFPQNLREGFTWIIDRGIYGIDTLNEIVKSKDHIITWEKDYKKGSWNDQCKKSGT